MRVKLEGSDRQGNNVETGKCGLKWRNVIGREVMWKQDSEG